MTARDLLFRLATALGGEIAGQQVLCPGPGHSPQDRSLSVRPSATAPDGFLTHSHAGDDWRACRDYVRVRLGVTGEKPPERSSAPKKRPANDDEARVARAADLWREAADPRGTLVETYLASRALTLAPEIANSVIRFHAACPWRDQATGKIARLPAMLALMRQVHGDQPTAVQRTALTADGRKIERRMLGIASGAAIKLDANAEVTLSLTIGEGFETCLSARQLSFRPTWALGSVAAVASFPVLAGIETLHILEETGDHGASARAVQECGTRWHAAGCEVIIVTPRGCEGDVNDVLMRWQRRKVG